MVIKENLKFKSLKLLSKYIHYIRGLKREGEHKRREARFFFFSQYFADGLRITLEILLPALIFSYFGHFATGLIVSMGAFCVSITDIPGPVSHKRNAMFFCTILIFLTTIVTGFARLNVYTMGLEILVLSFILSMFLVYGNRAGAVGSAAMVIMILMMDEPIKPSQVFQHATLVLAGGLWYMGLSQLFSRIRPYRPAQRALGASIHEIAKFLRIKADFYSIKTDLEADYSKLVAQQIVVSEKQDAVRELFFKTRMIVKESTKTSRLLILTFIEVVDLFEDIMATYYDYTAIRERFGKTGILDDIAAIIKNMSLELDNIGFAIQANIPYKRETDIGKQLEKLKNRIDAISESDKEKSTLVLKKVLVNMRNLDYRLDNIFNYFNAKATKHIHSTGAMEYSRFVSHQPFNLKILKDNLNFKSAIFKHSLRVALACLFGFILTKLIGYGEHSYWVILTISVILKPAFSLTKQRNIQRLAGTVIGGIIGAVILIFVPDKNLLFVFLLIFMIGTYSFLRTNYIMLVIFVTPYVFILFQFLGIGHLDLIQERILDTLLGCGIALTASYLIFPSWESEQLGVFMQKVLNANLNYLQKLTEILSGKEVAIADYKLSRKEVYISSANLASAFQRMLSEPKSRQKNKKDIHQFVVLNHILSSNIATIASGMLLKERPVYGKENLRPLKQALSVLTHSLKKLNPAHAEFQAIPEQASTNIIPDKITLHPDDKLLRDQLEFICKVSNDIGKITERYLRPPAELHFAENTEPVNPKQV